MAISTQIQNLNLIPGKSAPVVVHLSQGNVGNTVQFYLYDGDNPYYPTNVSIAVHGVRADNTVFGPYTVSVTSGSNLVSFDIVTAMTSVNGAAIGELVITDSSQNQIGSANFGMLVEETPYSSSVTYEDDLSIYQRILAYVQSVPAELQSQISSEASTRSSAVSNLQSQISSEASTRSSAVSNLQSQINQIVAPSGEAPSAAEVQNARIGADGVTYSTLGEAIRTQNDNLKSSLNDFVNLNNNILNDIVIEGTTTQASRITIGENVKAGDVIVISFKESQITGSAYHAYMIGLKTASSPVYLVSFDTYNMQTSQSCVYVFQEDFDYILLDPISFSSGSVTSYRLVYSISYGKEAAMNRAHFSSQEIAKGINSVQGLVNQNNLIEGSELWEGEWLNSNKWTDAPKTAFGFFPVKTKTEPWSGLMKSVQVERGKTYQFTAWVLPVNNTSVYATLVSSLSGHESTATVYPESKLFSLSALSWHKLELTFDVSVSGTVYPTVVNTLTNQIFVADFELHEVVSGIHVGVNREFKTLRAGIDYAMQFKNADVFIDDGVYDFIQEFGGISVFNGLNFATEPEYWPYQYIIGNGIKLHFSANSKVVADYSQGTNQNVRAAISVFSIGRDDNTADNSFEIYGLNLEMKGLRYCVHDDGQGSVVPYTHVYEGCRMYFDASSHTEWKGMGCIGGGFGNSCRIKINNCHFTSIKNPGVDANHEVDVHFHNSSDSGAKSEMYITNSWFANGYGSGYYGDSTLISHVYLSGNSFKKAPSLYPETDESTKINIENVAFCNEIRGN